MRTCSNLVGVIHEGNAPTRLAQSPQPVNVLAALASTSEREAIRARNADTLAAIATVVEQLEEAQTSLGNALTQMHDGLPFPHSRASSRVQQIVLYTAPSPRVHVQIMRLSQVSRLWRAVVKHHLPSSFLLTGQYGQINCSRGSASEPETDI